MTSTHVDHTRSRAGTSAATTGMTGTAPDRRQRWTRAVMVLSLTVIMVDAVVGILPAAPVVGLLTPLRLVLLAGLVAGVVGALRPRAWTTWLDLPILLLVVAYAASAVWSGQGWPVWRGLLTGVAACYLTVVLVRRHPSAWTAVTGSSLLGCAVAGLTGLHQWAAGTPTGFCRVGLVAGRETCGDPHAMIRVTGTLANPNVLAAVLVLLLPIAWAGATSLPTSSARLVGHAVVAAGAVALLMTWSRAGVVAGVVAVAVLALLRPARPSRLVRGLSVGAGAAAVLGVVLLGGSLGVRRDVWAAALRLAAAHPLGVGPGRGGALIDREVAGGERFQHAHDLWLSWLLEGGWAAGVAAVTLTLVAGWLVVRGARAGSAMARVAGAGLAGFAVMSLVDHPANALGVATLLWVVLGVVAGHRPTADDPARGGHVGAHRARPAGRS
ncbi:O-antigen ligase family protein [Arsenicicoccus sp. oral taxon 190]|uniref:O-antigen ligase family protein n=1 Tax=Arsenicicoccus sp. oral taxon 190 TaxID=1658671 RepID=UPI00067DD5F0|nr:O-antigen ligase family protein [Arsenicicoccus sp. oral taxon 190]